MIAVLVLIAAGVSFAVAWQRKTETLVEARGRAAYYAWLGVDSGPGGYLRGWGPGPDGHDYTRDDRALSGDWHATLDPMLDPLREPVDLLRMKGNPYDFMEENAFADLDNWGQPAGITFGFSVGRSIRSVEVEPILERLVTGTRTLDVESRVVLPSFWIDPDA